jgi:hypothetical protein
MKEVAYEDRNLLDIKYLQANTIINMTAKEGD